MSVEIVQNSFRQYIMNFKIALAFGLLLVFVIIFSFFPNALMSTGSILLEYNLAELLSAKMLFLLAAVALFSIFYALLITVMVFSVRKNLSTVRIHYYLREMIQKFTAKLSLFFFFYTLILTVAATLMIGAGIPIVAVGILFLLISLALLFVPQAVVIDEQNLGDSILNNLEFMLKHKRAFFLVIVIGAVLTAFVPLLEYAFDFVYSSGSFISLLFVLIFVLPFMETMKTYLYMLKFDIIRHHELAGK